MIQAVIFDMDGLLIDSEPFWQQAQKEAYATINIYPTKADLHATMGNRVNEVVEYWYHRQPWKGPSQADIVAQIVDRLLEQVRAKGTAKPGARAVLDLCKQQGLPMALASSSDMEIIDTVLDVLQIRDYFDHVYSAEHEPLGKPHPGVFVSTAAFLQVPARHCLVFEDSPAGVLAAKAAKMKCVAVPEPDTKEHPFIQTADLILDSLEAFTEKTLKQL